MKRVTLQTDYKPHTLSWLNDRLIDWSYSGRQYLLNGKTETLGNYGYGFDCDGAVTSDDGVYAVIYEKLGTKGVLLKNGRMLRELNRSYYQAHVYEYPANFFKAQNGKTYLIHCPEEYNLIELEEVETGKRVKTRKKRKPEDFFHSRFEVSEDNSMLMSRGWVWHPMDYVEAFNLEECLTNPQLLDRSELCPIADEIDEVFAGSFIDNESVLIGHNFETNETNRMAVWHTKNNQISGQLTLDFEIGAHLTVIDDTFAWDLYEYPKLFNYRTGELVAKAEDIHSGKQASCIFHKRHDLPLIAINKKTKQVAVATGETIEVLSM
ncbi:hypothetical protein [Emticicia agri]|uniref:Uncharacterized protein n=1 Tax=Emticicia agri TaxID=2492393 RepID=A0A4Q5LVU3_9BACT|nr:hypothetical protein [Emticicia agri]RYU93848.1 hypothetical protein EWM59_20220 [Emticicia agri]